MKYAIAYSKDNREEKRTRFLSYRTAVKREEMYQSHGFNTRMIPKSEFKEQSREL